MTDDHEPDPAALDELLRAFGGELVPAAADDDVSPTGGAESEQPDQVDAEEDPAGLGALVAAVDRAEEHPVVDDLDDLDDPIELVESWFDPSGDVPDPADEPDEEIGDVAVVEHQPLDDAVAPEPEPPSVIRIDDYSGSVTVEPVSPPSDPLLAAATPGQPEPHDQAGADESTSGEPIVISIEDEDLPDPVYIEGNLERSGSRSIVFIEDDDTGDTVAPEVDRNARRGIEPRMRERRAAVKRAIGRKRLRWLLAIASVVIVGVGTLAVLGSSLFAIQEDQVTVTGDVYADPAIVSAVVDDLVGTPALLVDTEQAEERLERIPWVDEARVRVSFPHAATIEIREREAMTTYMGPDLDFRVLDREGRVLDVLRGRPVAYMEIRGPDAVDLDPGQFAPQGYAAASDLAKTLTGSVRGRVEFIEVTANGSSLSLNLTDGTIVRFGAARDLLEKLIRLETVLAANPDLEPGVIDVSTSEVTL